MTVGKRLELCIVGKEPRFCKARNNGFSRMTKKIRTLLSFHSSDCEFIDFATSIRFWKIGLLFSIASCVQVELSTVL